MRKLALMVIILMIPLAGCAPNLTQEFKNLETAAQTKVVNPIQNDTVTHLGNALGVANAAVVGYARLPLCPAGHVITVADVCHDKALLVTLDKGMHAAYNAYDQLTNWQLAHPPGTQINGGGFGQLYANAKSAYDAVKAIISAYKIGGA